jgi:hypothetical protein
LGIESALSLAWISMRVLRFGQVVESLGQGQTSGTVGHESGQLNVRRAEPEDAEAVWPLACGLATSFVVEPQIRGAGDPSSGCVLPGQRLRTLG